MGLRTWKFNVPYGFIESVEMEVCSYGKKKGSYPLGGRWALEAASQGQLQQ